MGVIEEVGASAKTLLARFTSGIKAGQRVVAAPWPAAEGQGTSTGASMSAIMPEHTTMLGVASHGRALLQQRCVSTV